MAHRWLAALVGLGLAVPVARGGAQAMAAERQVTGVVTDAASGAPLALAQVQVKGTPYGTQSDERGQFALRVSAGDVILVVRRIGFGLVEVAVPATESSAVISMQPVVVDLDQIVVSGQATGVARRNLATAVTTVSSEELVRVSQQTIEHALQGKVPGAQISQRTGAPGGGNWVRIRGISTLLGGTTTPLYVVDGVIVADTYVSNGQSGITGGAGSESPANRITDFDPNDIETVEVLKGSAAAAIYGSKASSGVVLITTKRGMAGALHWSLGEGLGTSRLAYRNGHRIWSYEDAVAQYGPTAAQYFDPQTHRAMVELDYEDLAYGARPLNSDLSMSVRGGALATRFFLSAAARDEDGIVANTGAKKYSVRANLDQLLSSHATLQLGLSLMKNSDDRGFFDNENGPGGIGASVGYNVPRIPSFLDLRQRSDGSWPLNPFLQSNPLQNIALSRDHDEVWRGMTSAQLRWNLRESASHDIRLVAIGGADALVQRYTLFSPPEQQFEAVLATPGRASASDHRTLMSNLNLNLVDTWRPSPSVTATVQVGTQYERWSQDVLFTGSSNLAGGLDVVNAGSTTSFFLNDYRLRVEDFGVFAQGELLLNERLMLTVGGRLDRSSANADEGKFFAFPKASISYRLRQVPLGFLQEVKLRAAYGETGNRPYYGDKFSPLAQVTVGGNIGYRTGTNLAAPDLRPERQRELEGGVDVSLFSNRASVELTAFQHRISDLLLSGTPPPSTGYTSSFSNGGSLRVRGLEAALSAFPFRRGRVTWTSRATFGMNRSRVLSLRDTLIIFGSRLNDGQVWLRPGHSATEITGYDSLPAPLTIVRVGDGAPRWTGGWSNELRWGHFSLFALLDHQEGGRLYAGTWNLYEGARNSRDYDVLLADGTKLGDTRRGAAVVTRRLNQDATYTKLREVTLGWDVPPGVARWLGPARTARLAVSGRNLLWWTRYRGGDPEAENFYGGFALPQVQRNRELAAYPASRQYWVTMRVEY